MQYRVEFSFQDSGQIWYSEPLDTLEEVETFVESAKASGATVRGKEAREHDREMWEDADSDPNVMLSELRTALARFHAEVQDDNMPGVLSASTDVVSWAEALDERLSSKDAPIPSKWL